MLLMRVCVVGAGQGVERLRALAGAERLVLAEAQELERAGVAAALGRPLEELVRASGEPVLSCAGLAARAGELVVALRELQRRERLDELWFPARGALAWHAIRDARSGGPLRAARVVIELERGDESLAAPLGAECDLAGLQLRDATRFCLAQADRVAGDERAQAELRGAGWTLGSPRPEPLDARLEARLSVVMPHRDSPWIGETLASLRAQTHPIEEIVIVDDASSAAGLARLEAEAARDPRIRLHKLAANVGQAQARNVGIALAKGELIWFVDADNLMRPQMASRLLEALRCDPDAAWALSGVRAFHEETGETVFVATPHPPEFSVAPLVLENAGGDVCAIHRRDRLLAAGGFNPERRAPDDWLLWQRCAARGERGVLVPEVLFDYRWRPTARWVSATPTAWLRFVALGALHHPALLARGGEELALLAARHFGQQIERAQAAAADARSDAARLRLELDHAQLELKRAHDALDRAHGELDHARDEARDTHAELQAARASLVTERERHERSAREARQLRAALDEMASSSAVRLARALQGSSPRVHAALGAARRTAAGWLRLARKLREPAS